MCEYVSYLKQVYPQGGRYDALLPKTAYNNNYNFSEFGLECLGRIGEGALSTVYKVCDHKTRRIMAAKLTSLKHINGGECPASFVAERALKEIQLMLKIQKAGVQGIMPLVGYFPSEDTIKKYVATYRYIPKVLIPESSVILELMPLAVPFRCWMDEYHRRRKVLSEKQACAVFLDILSPIIYMHQNTDIIHRDVKVDNLMLLKQPNGNVRVAISDFNISKEFYGNTDSRYTPMGTPGYYNPRIQEKAINHERLTRSEAEKQDLYAAAQVMYILLNRGVMAVNKGEIRYPVDKPSVRFAKLLIEILNPDIAKVPGCAYVKKRLESMLKDETEAKQNRVKNRATVKPSSGFSSHRNNSQHRNQRPANHYGKGGYFPKGYF